MNQTPTRKSKPLQNRSMRNGAWPHFQAFLCLRYPQSQRNEPTAKLNNKITNEMTKALRSNSFQEPTVNSAQNKSQRTQKALSPQINQGLFLIFTTRNFPFSAIAHPFPRVVSMPYSGKLRDHHLSAFFCLP